MAPDPPIDAEERARLVLARLPAIMWTTDTDLRLTSGSGSALAALGVEPESLIGRSLFELFHTDDPGHAAIALHYPALGGASLTRDVRVRARDYRCHVQPLTRPDGSIAGVVGIAFDETERKRAEGELRRQLRLTQAIAQSLADGLIAVDRDLAITFVNEAAERMLGRAAAEMLGKDFFDVVGVTLDDGTPVRREESTVLGSIRSARPGYGDPVRPLHYTNSGGVRFPVLGTVAPILTETGVDGAVISFRDISEFHAMQSKLLSATERARRREAALTTLWTLVGRQDLDRDALARAILLEGSRTLGLECGSVIHVDGDRCVVDYLQNFGDPSAYLDLPLKEAAAELAVAEGETFASRDLRSVEAARKRKVVTQHGIRAYIGSKFNVGSRVYVLSFFSHHARIQGFDDGDRTYIELLAGFFGRHLFAYEQQERIVQLASIDPLTGLPNRAFFTRQLADRIAAERTGDERFAVFAVGLDRFKEVNSSLGHRVGDRVLLEASTRLRRVLRGEIVLARLGDDEFAVLLPRQDSPSGAEYLARRICESLAAPYVLGDDTVHLTASVGVAVAPEKCVPDDLLIQADVAMHRAKADGRNRFRFYSSDLALHLSRRRDVEVGLRKALKADEFVLVYQPFVNLISRSVVGVEALLRWRRPGHGMVNPEEFIALAEESGLIVPIGSWAFASACTQARRWAAKGKALRIAVNISARQLQDPAFVSDIETALSRSGVDPTMVGLEITESVAISDLLATRSVLQRCRDLGLRVALDDFGTSYSSLAYIRELPIDMIKVDRKFVDGLPGDRTSAAITRAVIAFGTSLGFDTLAEGIETVEQEHWLAREGCRTAQGFLFAKPMLPEAFEAWLTAWPHRSTVA